LEHFDPPARRRSDDDHARFDGAYRGRRISWSEFYKLTGIEPPANDNHREEEAA